MLMNEVGPGSNVNEEAGLGVDDEESGPDKG